MNAPIIQTPPLGQPALSIGYLARQRLRDCPRGQVLAVFGRGVYLRTDSGALCCLVGCKDDAGALSVCCPRWPLPGAPRTGEAWVCRRGRLSFAGGARLDIDAAELWRPGPQGRRLAQGLRALAAHTALYTDAPAGLAFLMPALARGWPGAGPPPAAPASNPIAAPALAAIAALDRGLRCGRPDPEAVALLGLGPGLTPSGDDFLCGTLFALDRLDRRDLGHTAAAWLLPLATRHCGPVSLAQLQAAAVGGAADLVDRALLALSDGGRDLSSRLAALERYGHCSGRDLLAGLVYACLIRLNSARYPVADETCHA